jgi:hypothetical protein
VASVRLVATMQARRRKEKTHQRRRIDEVGRVVYALSLLRSS